MVLLISPRQQSFFSLYLLHYFSVTHLIILNNLHKNFDSDFLPPGSAICPRSCCPHPTGLVVAGVELHELVVSWSSRNCGNESDWIVGFQISRAAGGKVLMSYFFLGGGGWLSAHADYSLIAAVWKQSLPPCREPRDIKCKFSLSGELRMWITEQICSLWKRETKTCNFSVINFNKKNSYSGNNKALGCFPLEIKHRGSDQRLLLPTALKEGDRDRNVST